jgi:glycosyltransferase involved in cell wall biosynthesis
MSKYISMIHNADNGGCGHYRMKYSAWAIQSQRKDVKIIESGKFIAVPKFYNGIRHVRVQRQISNDQLHIIKNFLKPLSDQLGFWLSYEIDDVIHMDDIPRYNMGWSAFQDVQLMANAKEILSICDFMTVTTEDLKQYYHKRFDVPRNNIIVVPNYMPKWWMDGLYYIDHISARFDRNKHKPRIGFISSTTHFDINNNNDGIDDFTHVIDFVRKTCDKYQFVFVGGCPKQLHDLRIAGKIECSNGFDILNYPKEIVKLNFDLTIAPLIDNVFNRGKSPIKFQESAAMGIPCFCQNISTYNKYTTLLFDNSIDLEYKVADILSNKDMYMHMVQRHRDIVDNGDVNAPNGWWLENNMQIWNDIYTIAQKSISIDLDKITLAESEDVPVFDLSKGVK